MNITTQLISAHRRQLPALAFLFVAITLCAFAPPSVRAGGEKPFHANFITKVESFVEYPFLHVMVIGRGQATYMGRTTAFTDNQLVSLIDGSLRRWPVGSPLPAVIRQRVGPEGSRGLKEAACCPAVHYS